MLRGKGVQTEKKCLKKKEGGNGEREKRKRI